MTAGDVRAIADASTLGPISNRAATAAIVTARCSGHEDKEIAESLRFHTDFTEQKIAALLYHAPSADQWMDTEIKQWKEKNLADKKWASREDRQNRLMRQMTHGPIVLGNTKLIKSELKKSACRWCSVRKIWRAPDLETKRKLQDIIAIKEGGFYGRHLLREMKKEKI